MEAFFWSIDNSSFHFPIPEKLLSLSTVWVLRGNCRPFNASAIGSKAGEGGDFLGVIWHCLLWPKQLALEQRCLGSHQISLGHHRTVQVVINAREWTRTFHSTSILSVPLLYEQHKHYKPLPCGCFLLSLIQFVMSGWWIWSMHPKNLS